MRLCPNCNTVLSTKNRTDYKGRSRMWRICKTCEFSDPGMNMVINEVFLFVMTDEEGNEGVPAVRIKDIAMPLIATDKERLEYLRPIAHNLAQKAKRKIKLLRFSTREEVEVIE